ncbi:subtilisin family serine protease [Micromonospora jinlongensis]|uniref:Subtilisin family serine protease n=1 Tax=Micromonospora jinlongensis TaxID=1287877 RepID=A0A7Y9X092_9ACTN|nr:S8 family peptidase [Micromonospora jinlongensis]NYH41655.1 subtilisin family serine protease [Micromonospora jinlongensis]
MLRKTRWLLAIAVTATTLTALPGGSATAGPGGIGTTDTPRTSVDGKTHTVTLLTGDVVTVRSTGSGCPKATVRPADENAVIQQTCGPDGHLHVVPARVASQIGPVLDPDLFDVTALIADGYDDENTTELPVIVQPATASARVAALGDVLSLPSIGAVAGHVPKKSPATAKLATDSLLAGAKKVWLDRKVRATALTGGGQRADLDRNLGQIAAPDAWKAGYTGRGTTVAVLDTGADFTHPDLVGRVADRADFTADGGDAVDHNGHGTHVASTIAGTGAAANGQRRGVAPDAKLVIGKVLDDHGSGADSGIIAGMEWAATRADVINMSLGGSDPDDGNDPLSLAVDGLSRSTGALFVIAAGNSGGAISSPGSAASALTVGAVDRNDKLADFSSRGPLVTSNVAKPELVAPGVDIVAARAAGTNLQDPIDRYYEAISGTSMASPHVAGAAALLAQRHPDWTGAQLKAALVGAADPLSGVDAYAVGAGRLNAARALGGPTSDQPVVNLGTFAYPQSGTSEAKLSWTGESAAVLDLDVTVVNHDGQSVPRGAASLSASRVTLKRGATAGATVRINRAALAARPGFYLATVTARTAGHKLVSTTPVSFYVEQPSYDLTIRTKPLPGLKEGAESWINLLVTNLTDPVVYYSGAGGTPGDTFTLRVPAGRYAILGSSVAYYVDSDVLETTLAAEADLDVRGARTVTLDPARARPVTATVDGVRTTPTRTDLTNVQTAPNGLSWWHQISGYGAQTTVRTTALPKPGVGSRRTWAAVNLDSPAGTAKPYRYNLVHEYAGGVPGDPAFRVSKSEQAKLARIEERFHQMDSEGMVTQLIRSGFTPDGVPVTQTHEGNLPPYRTDYLSPGYLWADEGVYGGLSAQEAPRTYQPGSRQTKVWARQPLHSGWYDDPAGAESSCATAPSRTRGNLHIDLVSLTDQHQRADCLQGGSIGVNRKLSVYRNGKLVDERDRPLADVTVAQQMADYRLTLDVDTSLILPISTRVNTSWTFRSAGPDGTGSVPLPLLAVDYALPMDTLNHATGGTAELTVRQMRGIKAQKVTSFQVWTSTDDGATWTSARVTGTGDSYRVALPTAATGQPVSLRVKAAANGGSGIDQTIIRAYNAG